MKNIFATALAITAMTASAPALAATTTTTFGVSATVEAQCTITSAAAMAFGTVGSLASNVDKTSDIVIKCTNTTPFNIGLNAGTATSATVTTRKMTGTGASPATLSYSLFSDSARTVNWGNTVGTDTKSGTGTGSDATFTVYGRIPIQTAPKPDTYSDTITVTVTY